MQSSQRLVAYLLLKNHELFKSVTHTAELLDMPRRTLYDQHKKQGPLWRKTVTRLNELNREYKIKKNGIKGYSCDQLKSDA